MDNKMKLKIAGVIATALILLVGGIFIIALKNGQTQKIEQETTKIPEQIENDSTTNSKDKTETTSDNNEPETNENNEVKKNNDNELVEEKEQSEEEKIIKIKDLPESVTSVIDVNSLQKELGTWLNDNGMENVTSMSYTDEEDMDTAHNSKSIILLADDTVKYVMCTYSINDDSYTFMEM